MKSLTLTVSAFVAGFVLIGSFRSSPSTPSMREATAGRFPGGLEPY